LLFDEYRCSNPTIHILILNSRGGYVPEILNSNRLIRNPNYINEGSENRLNPGNVSYSSAQNFLSSSLLSKNVGQRPKLYIRYGVLRR
jgi:hypothetical protein